MDGITAMLKYGEETVVELMFMRIVPEEWKKAITVYLHKGKDSKK